MKSARLEALSDGVIAIIMTIMVLEMKVPQSPELEALQPVAIAFFSYVLSFIYVGIYWSNHHHVFQATERVDGMTLWANLHLLFWLSLIPFVTRWMGGSTFSTWPVAAYGVVLFMSAFAWDMVRRRLIHLHAPESALVKATGGNFKDGLSLVLYGIAVGAAFIYPGIACALYALVAVIWFVPDRRIESEIALVNETLTNVTNNPELHEPRHDPRPPLPTEKISKEATIDVNVAKLDRSNNA